MNKIIQNLLFFYGALFFSGCVGQATLFRKVVVVDYKTQEIISSAKVSLVKRDAIINVQVEDVSDTLNVLISNGKYQIETLAIGYKKVQETILLTKADNLIIINLIPIELYNVNVSWDGAIITIKDSLGKFKILRHKN